jgi:hypothetical protein
MLLGAAAASVPPSNQLTQVVQGACQWLLTLLQPSSPAYLAAQLEQPVCSAASTNMLQFACST